MHQKMLLNSLRVALILPLLLFAEMPQKNELSVAWEKPFGGDENDIALGVTTTKDKGYVVVGQSRSFGEGKTDFMAIKLDETGAIKWQKSFGGKQRDEPRAVAESVDGSLYMGGITKSFTEKGDANIYVVKTDANGKQLWQKLYGGEAKDEAFSLLALKDGGVLVAGSTKSFGKGSYDAYLLKLDSSGNVVWDKTYGGKRAEHIYDIAATGDGGYFLVGSTESWGQGEADSYLLKIDANGNEQWSETFGESKSDVLYAIAVAPDGGAYVTGKTRSYESKKTDLDLFKLNRHGRLVWHKVIGFKNHEYANDLVLTENGVLVVGMTKSLGHGRADFYLLEFNESGNIIWGNMYGGDKYDIAHAVTATPDGGFVVVGESESYGEESDYYMIKLKREK